MINDARYEEIIQIVLRCSLVIQTTCNQSAGSFQQDSADSVINVLHLVGNTKYHYHFIEETTNAMLLPDFPHHTPAKR